MVRAIVITTVKKMLQSTLKAIEAICENQQKVDYFVYNDFSTDKTKIALEKMLKRFISN